MLTGADDGVGWRSDVQGVPKPLQMAENHLNLPTQRPIFYPHSLFTLLLLLLFILLLLQGGDGRESSQPSHPRPIFNPHSLLTLLLLLILLRLILQLGDVQGVSSLSRWQRIILTFPPASNF